MSRWSRCAANTAHDSILRMTTARIKVFFDGGCRPNPGPIEVAVVLRGVAHILDDCGHGSSGDAEWLALLRAAELARPLGFGVVTLVGDSLPVVRAARAALASGLAPNPHAAALLRLVGEGPPPHLRWCKRAQNLAGIALAARHPR